MPSPLAAMNAYAAAARSIQDSGGGGAASGSGPAAGADFTAMIENAVQGATQQVGQAEQLTAQAALGQAELVDVVTAVSAAEATMETMISVRDEVIKAYQEILRMPM